MKDKTPRWWAWQNDMQPVSLNWAIERETTDPRQLRRLRRRARKEARRAVVLRAAMRAQAEARLRRVLRGR